MKNRNISLILLFLLLVPALAPFNVIEAQEEWELIERGANFIRRQQVGTDIYSWESTPQMVFDGADWVPYIYEETDDYYQVQSGLIGARIYKSGYAEFWNPEMTEVRLYEEAWEVQYWTGNKWSVCDTYSPEYTVSSDDTTVNITASFITDWPNGGERAFTVKYIFREGDALKHEIDFTSYASEQYEFRVLQKWAGIVAAKVKHDKGEDVINSATTVNSSKFKFLKEDGSLSIFEDQWDMYYGEKYITREKLHEPSGEIRNATALALYPLTNQNLKPVTVDVHAQGLKADFIFGNWTLAQDESLAIDPSTYTATSPTDDASVSETSPDSNYGSSTSLRIKWDWSDFETDYYFFIKFSIASIPDPSTINSVTLKLYVKSFSDGHTRVIFITNNSWTEEVITHNNRPTEQSGIEYVDGPESTGYWESSEPEYIPHVQAMLDENLVTFRVIPAGTNYDNEYYCDSKEDFPDPQLIVVYTLNNVPTVTSASIPDRDDSDNVYAQRKFYTYVAVVNDLDGADTITDVHFQIKNGVAVVGEFRATSLDGTPGWAIQIGADIFDLDTGSCTWQEAGNQGTATFKISTEWDAPQYDDLELAVNVVDEKTESSGWTVKQTNYFDMINRLVSEGFSSSDGRTNKGEPTTLSGTIYYSTTTSGNTASSLQPYDSHFTAIHIHDSAHGSKGSDTTIVNGIFSIGPFNIPDAVQANSYHIYLDLIDDYVDGDAPDGDIVNVIGDRYNVTDFWASNDSPRTGETVYLYVTAELEYDGHAPEGEDTLVIEGEEYTWDWENERFYLAVNKSTAGALTYDDLNSISEYSYNITIGNMNDLSVTVTWYDHEFHFYGLYNENGTFADAYNISAHLPSETEVFEVDGYLHKFFVEEPTMFSWSLSGGGNRYIYQFQDNETIYFFTPDATYAIYSFTIRDYTGSIGFADTFLESLRVINGTEHMIERMLIWDTANTVPLTLVQSQIYALQVRFADGSTYRFGYFIPGVAATPTLSIYAVAFSDQAHIVAEHVTVEASRPTDTHIRVNYKDELDDTDEVFVEVCLLNETQVWNDTGIGDILQFNWYGADNETDYMVKVEITHGYYGELTYSCWLTGAQADPEDPFDLTLFGDWPIEGAFAVFLIIGTACLFSRASGVIGIGVTVLMAAALTGVGWIDISYSVLAASFTLVVLWGLSGGNK